MRVCQCVLGRSMCTKHTRTRPNISFNSLPTDVAANNILRWIIFIFPFHFSFSSFSSAHNRIQWLVSRVAYA